MGGALSLSWNGEEEKNASFASPLIFRRFPSSTDLNKPDTYNECRTLLSKIKGHPVHKAQLTGLEGEDAQNMVDFLSTVAHEQGILDHGEGKFALLCLHSLAKKNGVFPRHYELREIDLYAPTEYGGTFSDFFTGEYRSQKLGIKVIRLVGQDKANVLKMFVKELTLWAHLSHANILPFYGVYLHSVTKRICLVSPWIKNGNLREYLNARQQTARLPLISDIINGLCYLHRRNIVHGDLKAANVLISDDGRALIGDFGLSYIAVASGLTTSSEVSKGTPRWMAPELLQPDNENVKQTFESDIWSFSCLCYEVLTRKFPFYKLSDIRVVVLLATRREIPPLPDAADIDAKYDKVDPRMWAIMEKCWSYIPAERPTCEALHCGITALNILDDRPEANWRPHNGLFFWQEMRANSGAGVDYNRVRDILLKESTIW